MIDVINPCEHVNLNALTISLETDFVICWGTNKSKYVEMAYELTNVVYISRIW